MKFQIELVSKPDSFTLGLARREFPRPQADFSLVLDDPLGSPGSDQESWCFDMQGQIDVDSLGFEFEETRDYGRVFLPRSYQPWSPDGQVVFFQGWHDRVDPFSFPERAHLRRERIVGLRSFAIHRISGLTLVGRGTSEGMEWECMSPRFEGSVRLRPETIRSSGCMAGFWVPGSDNACLFDPGDERRKESPVLIFLDPSSGAMVHREVLVDLAGYHVVDAEFDYQSSVLRVCAKDALEFFVRIGSA